MERSAEQEQPRYTDCGGQTDNRVCVAAAYVSASKRLARGGSVDSSLQGKKGMIIPAG